MTFPAIPVAFTGPTPQRPGADLPQIAGPTGLAVQRFGALLAGLAPHAAQNGPLADAGLVGADPAQDPTTPQKGDVAQLAGAAEGPAQTNDAETADIFQGLGAPEGEENAPVLAPDLSVDLVPNTAFLVAPAQPLPHLPVGGAGDAFTHQDPQFGAPTLPVVGGAVAVVSAPGVEMPATPLPGGGQNLAQPSLLRPAHLAAGGSGPFGPLAPATMPLSTGAGTGTGDALGLWAAAPMADGDYTQYAPPPPLAPAAGASPNSAGQWPAAMAAPQPGLPLSAGPTAADGPQRPLAPAPGPMPAPPLPATIPVLGPENGPIAALDQGQTSRPNIAQTFPAPSPDYAKPLPPLHRPQERQRRWHRLRLCRPCPCKLRAGRPTRPPRRWCRQNWRRRRHRPRLTRQKPWYCPAAGRRPSRLMRRQRPQCPCTPKKTRWLRAPWLPRSWCRALVPLNRPHRAWKRRNRLQGTPLCPHPPCPHPPRWHRQCRK